MVFGSSTAALRLEAAASSPPFATEVSVRVAATFGRRDLPGARAYPSRKLLTRMVRGEGHSRWFDRPSTRVTWSRVSQIGYRAVSDALSRLLYFVTLVYAARRLTPDAFGVVVLGTTAGWLAGVVTDFGLQLHAGRLVAQSPDAAARLTWPLWDVRLRAAGLMWGLLTLGALVAAPIDVAVPFALIALAQLLLTSAEFLYHVCRARGRADIESTFVIAQRVLGGAGSIAVLWLAPGLLAFSLSFVVPAALLVVAASAAVRRLIGEPTPTGAPQDANWGETYRTVWPLGVGLVLSALYFRVDTFFVGYWDGAAGAARYGAVFRLVDAIRLLPAAVLAVTFPALCVARTFDPVRTLTMVLTMLGVVLAVATAVGADVLVSMTYGRGFLEAVPALRVLAAAVPLFFANYALTHQLVAWDAQARYAQLCAGALVVNVIGNVLLVPSLGPEGAAWTTVVTELFVTGACLAALRATRASRRGQANPEAR